MLPTLCNGERLVISNLFYEPAPGDIVVLCGEADREEGRNLIKRIIAVGGQTIDIGNLNRRGHCGRRGAG